MRESCFNTGPNCHVSKQIVKQCFEVKNLTRAITLAYQYKKEMKTPLLTVGVIQDFHKEVLKINQRAGKLRDCHVCTNCHV